MPFASRNSIMDDTEAMELSWPCIFKIVSCVSRRSLLIVAAWLIMTYLRNGFLKLSWKASFRDSYRFHWRSVRLWRCTQREKVGSSKAIRSRGDHRLGGSSPRKFLNLSNLGARECHFLRYPQDILLSTKENANGYIFYPSPVLSLRYSDYGKG